MADNSSRKFKFISPGVFVDEIDNSQLPDTPAPIGPLVIGRASRGPGMTPVTVNSFSEFVETFGDPVPGGDSLDVWRLGNKTAPVYGGYAAQAWLKNNPTVTYIRLLGTQDPDAVPAGYAGWRAGTATVSTDLSSGGSWGLVVWPSGSLVLTSTGTQPACAPITGALAAVLYAQEGHFFLSGTRVDGTITGSACELYEFTGGNIKLGIAKNEETALKTVTVSLDPSRPNFIRNVLNTNPTLTNDAITAQTSMTSSFGGRFWVGETFEHALEEASTTSTGVLVGSGSADVNVKTGTFHAAVVAMVNQKTTTEDQNDFRFAATTPSTGWFIAQDLSEDYASYSAKNMQPLFRFEALTAGEGIQREVKISISNIKAPRGDFEEYGSFSVLIRKISDTDNAPVILERYDSLNLNPASPNYIGIRIGDRYSAYDTSRKANREYGQYPNNSNYVRVVVNTDLERGSLDPRYLPFGVFGPLKYRDLSYQSGSAGFGARATFTDAAGHGGGVARSAVETMMYGTSSVGLGYIGGSTIGVTSYRDSSLFVQAQPSFIVGAFSGNIINPSVPLRKLSTWGEPKNNQHVFWGAWSGQTATNANFNPSLNDMLRVRNYSQASANTNPASTTHDIASLDEVALITSDPLMIAHVFSLDDVSGSFISGSTVASSGSYAVGNRVAGTSISANSAYTGTLGAGYDRFTTFLHGGSDGFDIKERDPLRLGGFSGVTNEKASYQLHTLKRAINIISDVEDAQFNVVTMPGITQNTATSYLLDTIEDRGDALAIVDIQNVYTPASENAQDAASRNAFTVKACTDALIARGINNSYGATYYPWVLIQDTVNQRSLWAPPSVVALGALSTTDRQQAPWFAPAGFARGGLSDGAGGVPVLEVSRRVNSEERDALYEANINPIAKFPAEGIVVFGQKTLQQTASALDRINVRRLMIFLKREISFVASRLLFAPNTQETWDRFTSQAQPILSRVKSQFGIDDFKLILDKTTTTPDLIDRNILYAKLMIKPTRSVEYFAIDFVVENSGASFDD